MTGERDEDLEARRKKLQAELNEVRREAGLEKAQERKAEASRKGYAEAMKLSSEFIAAIGRAPIVKTSRRIPPTPVAAP